MRLLRKGPRDQGAKRPTGDAESAKAANCAKALASGQ